MSRQTAGEDTADQLEQDMDAVDAEIDAQVRAEVAAIAACPYDLALSAPVVGSRHVSRVLRRPLPGVVGRPTGRMFFHILGAVAEFERALISERTREGLDAARARGRAGDQKPKLGPRQVALAKAMYAEVGDDGKRRYTVAQIGAEFAVSRPQSTVTSADRPR